MTVTLIQDWCGSLQSLHARIISYSSKRKKECIREQSEIEKKKEKKLEEDFFNFKSDGVLKELKETGLLLTNLVTMKAESDFVC